MDPFKQMLSACIFIHLGFFSPIKDGTSKSHI